MIASQGVGAWLWIVDAEDAYQQLKIRKELHPLLGFTWRQKTYIFTVLMLGISCAPRIYTEFADAVLAMLVGLHPELCLDDVIRLIQHYLDDFFGVHRSKEIATAQFNALKQLFNALNIPFTLKKAFSPAQWQKILGLIHDTLLQGVRFPEGKAAEYREEVEAVRKLACISKKEAQSLTGKLRWACKVFFGGEGFVRHLEFAASQARYKMSKVAITDDIRDDLSFWSDLLLQTDYFCPYDFILRDPKRGDVKFCTDASGCIGMGGVCTDGSFFQIRWSSIWPRCERVDIFFGESLALAVMIKLRAKSLQGLSVTAFIDNEPAQKAFAKKYCIDRRKDVGRLIRETCKWCSISKTRYWTEHITTEQNIYADCLSRFEPIPVGKQDECFGIYEMSELVPEEEVKQAVAALLGPLWSETAPPVAHYAHSPIINEAWRF